jgi:maltooligosyltrehalose trehalohydrolase
MVLSPSQNDTSKARSLPVGVEVVRHSGEPIGVHARVWAPNARKVELVVDEPQSTRWELQSEDDGYFSAFITSLGASTQYRLSVDGSEGYPDPASRYQPVGPHGPSSIVDPKAYTWSDAHWKGIRGQAHVIYEIHIGTFTKDGTFQSAIERLPDLVDLGVTVIEVMPVADFSGQFGWGYDGVNFFAPSRLYGTPDDLRAFIDAAHRLELGVILDVVYNHFGPDGNFISKFSSTYVGDRATEWGGAINFNGEGSKPVREFFLANARYWVEEFHFDGLRLDATQSIYDEQTPHIISQIREAVRDAAGDRGTLVVAENERQQAWMIRSRAAGGCELDALWNDDFHHAARVAVTGRDEAYYSGYTGRAQEFISAAKYGFLYQGQSYPWQGHRRGTPTLDQPPNKFITFIQNHDQIANSSLGARLHKVTSPGRFRAVTALLLLMPQTPMLFQGQEFASSSPFLYFADHNPDLARLVREGRKGFMSQFPSIASVEGEQTLNDPGDPDTFVRCKLDWSERHEHSHMLDLHRDLLRLRREDPVLRVPKIRGADGAVFSDDAFVLRFFGEAGNDRMLVVNFGRRLHASPIAIPLTAPPLNREWRTLFSTESPKYGGAGTVEIETPDDGWWIPAESAILLHPADDDTTSS